MACGVEGKRIILDAFPLSVRVFVQSRTEWGLRGREGGGYLVRLAVLQRQGPQRLCSIALRAAAVSIANSVSQNLFGMCIHGRESRRETTPLPKTQEPKP